MRFRSVCQNAGLDRRRIRLEVPALGTAIANDPQELLPSRFDTDQPLLFHRAAKPRLCATALEVERNTLLHRGVAFGACLRLRHYFPTFERDGSGARSNALAKLQANV